MRVARELNINGAALLVELVESVWQQHVVQVQQLLRRMIDNRIEIVLGANTLYRSESEPQNQLDMNEINEK
jgi:hypothetical protein